VYIQGKIMKNFKNKVAIITGGASGIGRSLCEQVAQNGARVIVSDFNGDMLEETVKAIKQKGHQARGVRLDVTDYDAFKKVIDDTVSQEGRLDYIFNNAGIAIAGEIRDVAMDQWLKVLDVNLNGVIYGTVHAYQVMVRQGFGHIVNISSIEGLIGFPHTASYVASKFGVMGLSQSLWMEGSGLGVDVSVVCPGFIRTAIFNSPVINMDREKWVESLEPIARFGISPEECARRMLKGVARRKLIIPITGWAKVVWWLYRISPTLALRLFRHEFRKNQDKVRISTEAAPA
jgi:NAD(P)-dependent dehydrogenase (short-subunit alcohol dehydrogenase family)